jgi:hypothetical protein
MAKEQELWQNLGELNLQVIALQQDRPGIVIIF